jgi:hypothetical protein
VDAHRFLVARLVLKRDPDKIAGLEHLGGGLCKPALVAVERRHGEQAWQDSAEHQERNQRRRAPASGKGIEKGQRRRGFHVRVAVAQSGAPVAITAATG